jgi:hypothetical protein
MPKRTREELHRTKLWANIQSPNNIASEAFCAVRHRNPGERWAQPSARVRLCSRSLSGGRASRRAPCSQFLQYHAVVEPGPPTAAFRERCIRADWTNAP